MNAQNKRLMISVGLGILINPLNSSMVTVAIPRLQQAFRLDFTVVSWMIFAFYIASVVAQPVMGKSSDLFGRRKVFLAGLVVSFAASLAAPLSPSFWWLIALRVVQSIGTSMMIAVGLAIVRIHVREKQATAVSVLTVFTSGAAAIGPFIGGMLMYLWDWQAIFLVNIPFATASLLFAWKIIPKDEPPQADESRMSVRGWLNRIDATGILLFTAGLVALLVCLLSVKSSGHLALPQAIAGLAGLALLAVFVRHELKAASPFIPLRTFAEYPALTRVNVEFMAVNLFYYALLFGIPSYLQTVRHVGEFHAGILMLSLGLSSLATSPLAGRWIERSGPRPALLASAILMVLGSAWMATWGRTSPEIGVCAALALFGVSNGLSSVGMQVAFYDAVPKEIVGVASGIFSMSRYLGAILSSLLIGVVMGGTFTFAGFRLLGAILAAIASVLLLMLRRRRHSARPMDATA